VPFLVALHPPEVSPRQQPYRVTAARALSPSGGSDIRTASPRRRRQNHARPQGLAPLPSPWRHPVLPPGLARSSLGLAFQIEPDPGANRRPGRPAGHARRRSPRPRHRTGGGNPHPTAYRRHRSTRWEARTPDRQVRNRQANKRGSASWTGRNPRARFPRMDEVHPGCERFQGSRWGFLRLHGRASRSQLRSSRSHDLLCLGFTAGSRGAPDRGLGTPPPVHCRSSAAAEATRLARSSTAKGKPSSVSERSRSARRPGSRAISTKVAPFQGRRDPACRRPCTGVW